jgi:hypothetical protein
MPGRAEARELAFDREEHLGRLRRVRALMAEQKVDLLYTTTPGHVCYFPTRCGGDTEERPVLTLISAISGSSGRRSALALWMRRPVLSGNVWAYPQSDRRSSIGTANIHQWMGRSEDRGLTHARLTGLTDLPCSPEPRRGCGPGRCCGAPHRLSAYSPAPITGESPSRPGWSQGHPLVLTAVVRLPSRSWARKLTVPWAGVHAFFKG